MPRRRDYDDEDEFDDEEDEIERPRPRGGRRRRPDPLDDPALKYVLPVNTSGWAIAAGYLGLFAVICLPAPVALIVGLVAIGHVRRKKLNGMGRAVFGTVMGGLGTAFMAFFLVLGLVQGK
jgi:hypothetical protein